jgi:hypothetical protein
LAGDPADEDDPEDEDEPDEDDDLSLLAGVEDEAPESVEEEDEGELPESDDEDAAGAVDVAEPAPVRLSVR